MIESSLECGTLVPLLSGQIGCPTIAGSMLPGIFTEVPSSDGTTFVFTGQITGIVSQRFVFMTGVSKFSKVSFFSKLNNLTDLTMDAKSAILSDPREKILVGVNFSTVSRNITEWKMETIS